MFTPNIRPTGTTIGTAVAITGGTDIVAALSTVVGSSSMLDSIRAGGGRHVQDTTMATPVMTVTLVTNRGVRLSDYRGSDVFTPSFLGVDRTSSIYGITLATDSGLSASTVSDQ